MRADLNMRKGKMVAQGAHASLGAILKLMTRSEVSPEGAFSWTMSLPLDSPVQIWLDNSFTKICVSVNSEEELCQIYLLALGQGIPCCLITDNGTTEFGGIPIKTCCAIGPWNGEDIDKITGGLKLL